MEWGEGGKCKGGEVKECKEWKGEREGNVKGGRELRACKEGKGQNPEVNKGVME